MGMYEKKVTTRRAVWLACRRHTGAGEPQRLATGLSHYHRRDDHDLGATTTTKHGTTTTVKPTTTTGATTTSRAATTSSVAGTVSSAPSTSISGRLPFTGASTVPLLFAGLALLGLGAVSLFAEARRRRA
jgi:hypothetical protein